MNWGQGRPKEQPVPGCHTLRMVAASTTDLIEPREGPQVRLTIRRCCGQIDDEHSPRIRVFDPDAPLWSSTRCRATNSPSPRFRASARRALLPAFEDVLSVARAGHPGP